MAEKNLDLPSVDEIDFELKEIPEKETFEPDTKKLRTKILETEQIFKNLKDRLDKLKQEEEQFELKKEEWAVQEKRIEDYKKKLKESMSVIEIMKQTLGEVNLELEKNNKKSEYYKNKCIELSTNLDSATTKLNTIQKQYFYFENKIREVSKTNSYLRNYMGKMDEVISNLKTSIIKKDQLNNRLTEVLEFITRRKLKESKKGEFYKSQYLDSIGKGKPSIEDFSRIKTEQVAQDKKYQILLENNMLLEGKLKEVTEALIKLQQEFDSKQNLFNEREEKIKEMKKKSIYNLTDHEALKEKSDKIEKMYKEATERNEILEQKTKDHLVLLKELKDRLADREATFEERIETIKKENETKVKILIEQNTKTELELRAQIKMLKAQIERQQTVLKEKERREKEIISNLNMKFSSLLGKDLEEQ